jgi:hypothetical protein
MGALSQRILAKVSGPAWEQLRGPFLHMARLLLAVSPDADSDLLTTYVKFSTNSDATSPVYAAVWLKNSKRLIVGLALPEQYEADELGPALPGTTYRGLNKYFVVERGSGVPNAFDEWARLAYQNALSAGLMTGFQPAPSGKLRRAG